MKPFETDHLKVVLKEDDVFTHEEIIYLNEDIMNYEVIGIVREGREYVKAYKRIN